MSMNYNDRWEIDGNEIRDTDVVRIKINDEFREGHVIYYINKTIWALETLGGKSVELDTESEYDAELSVS